MTVLPRRHYSEHHTAVEEEGDTGIPQKGFGERNVSGRLHVQMEEDGGNSTR